MNRTLAALCMLTWFANCAIAQKNDNIAPAENPATSVIDNNLSNSPLDLGVPMQQTFVPPQIVEIATNQAIMTPCVILQPACGCQQIVYLAQTSPHGELIPVYSGSSFTTEPMHSWPGVPAEVTSRPPLRPVLPMGGYGTTGRILPLRRGGLFLNRGRWIR